MQSVNYTLHYLSPKGMVMMLLIAAVAVAVCMVLILLVSRSKSAAYNPKDRRTFFTDEVLSLTDRLFELIFSATFILLFVGIYFTIEYFGISPALQGFWNKYNGIILLVFILGSVMLNSWIDNKVIPLSHLRPGERETMRQLGMLYMLVIFLYIKFIYDDSNYDSIIMYFITLVIGRFVYFDASMDDFKDAMKDAGRSLPLLALALACSGIIAWYGFGSGYLLRPNGVVMNLFLGHLYLLVVIFIVNRTGFLEKILLPALTGTEWPDKRSSQKNSGRNEQDVMRQNRATTSSGSGLQHNNGGVDTSSKNKNATPITRENHLHRR